jgi:hypothetical protein
MKRRFLKAPSPAMTVACIALAVALSGAGYAAVTLPRNSVGTPQLKKNAVNSAKVKDRSLRANDFALGQLPAGAQGPQGAPGPRGTSVVARARNLSSITTSGTTETNWPLAGNTWTQAADETNEFLVEVTVTPSGCVDFFRLQILLDGEVVMELNTSSSVSRTYRLTAVHRLDPGIAVTHQLTARVSDQCASGDVSFSGLKINVLASS